MINEIRYKKDEYGNIHIMPYFEVKILYKRYTKY
jgi:hypothetical protein